MNSGWHGSIDIFMKLSISQWLNDLENHHLRCMNAPASESQINAWRECFQILQKQLIYLIEQAPITRSWSIVFEYELPRERGRRPDVIILGDRVYVLEFKGFKRPYHAHIDQISAYARDLKNYHAATHDHLLVPILVLTNGNETMQQKDVVYIISAPNLGTDLSTLVGSELGPGINAEEWLSADYAPLPSLVAAARTIFLNEPLPQIRRAQSAGIPETIAELLKIADEAQEKQELHLALVTGVPGAGKTLVGLQFVYHTDFSDYAGGRKAVLLSGNGPLVKVLKHALNNSIFVQDVHGFLKQYGGKQSRRPEEHIWVYDEAQRAWDAERVGGFRGHPTSEPEDFLRIGARMDSWAMMIGLIGEGQEIHLGEESGLKQWNDAIAAMPEEWVVHCPTKVASLFAAATAVNTHDNLDLNTSLRSHLAEDVQVWIKQLLDGRIVEAIETARRIQDQGFDIYLTRRLESAKKYVEQRYDGQEDKRYGYLASSKAKNLSIYGIENSYNFTRALREGPWYNDSPSSPRSCCQLHDVATEFACQGLELDFPIIGWGDDLMWNGDAWQSPPQIRSKAKNPHQLRINSYRVLLSRGRDGFMIFVPPEEKMNINAEILVKAGVTLI
jgi:DUF2075 family protein